METDIHVCYTLPSLSFLLELTHILFMLSLCGMAECSCSFFLFYLDPVTSCSVLTKELRLWWYGGMSNSFSYQSRQHPRGALEMRVLEVK